MCQKERGKKQGKGRERPAEGEWEGRDVNEEKKKNAPLSTSLQLK